MKDERSVRFIGAAIEVLYDRPPALEKRPGPPDALSGRDGSTGSRRC
ncbi:MAG: hypothetical protein NZ769_05880 [Anaerolineae bacterium]|nr:hypothetical protein [Anaerolineae bacterium]MCX8067084.1 hypothetical protein [Anaerolineae bacterium]